MSKLGNVSVSSPEGDYRYTLWREVRQASLLTPDRGCVNFVMLNPSKALADNPDADPDRDDPTVRKIVGFADRLGFSRVIVTNLYALCATDPRKLLEHPDPVGPANDAAIRECAKGASQVIAAWGMGPGPGLRLDERARDVLRLIGRPVHCLQLCEDQKHPRHPLYLPYRCEPFLYFNPNQEGANP